MTSDTLTTTTRPTTRPTIEATVHAIVTKRRPNVLLLTADALRTDRLGVYGYGRPTSPCLDRLAESAIVCDNALTLGPFTQIACIQLFTSSRPLSHGGYDRGAEGRPDTLFKRFRDAGYRTWGLSTIHWVSPYYGYTDGLETEIGVFHLNTLVGMAVVNTRDTLRAYGKGTISSSEMLVRVTPVIEKLFSNVETYCDTLKDRIAAYRADFPGSKMVNDGYDLDKVKRIIADHRHQFAGGPLQYLRRHLGDPPVAKEWLSREWYYARTPGKLVREAAFRASNRALRLVNPRLAHARTSRVRLSVDAHAIAAKVIGCLVDREPSRPFFIWAHFKDTHRPFVSGPGLDWYRHTPEYLQALGYPRDLDPTFSFRVSHARSEEDRTTLSALYDAAVRSTDEAVGNILSAVERLGLADDTVIAFCGDHGEEIGEHGDYGHECMGYEHNARVPMIFRPVGGGGQRIGSLISSLDWAPTLCALAGVEPAPGWEGAPVTSDEVAARRHIVLETFCRGDCLFDHRPLYMGVRTKTHKYLWKEYVDPHHRAGSPGPELYDLGTDPGERHNIWRPGHPLAAGFDLLIAERLAQIPEISSARIAAAFGAAGEGTVRRVRGRAVPKRA